MYNITKVVVLLLLLSSLFIIAGCDSEGEGMINSLRARGDATALLFRLGCIQNTFERSPHLKWPRTEAAMRDLNNTVTFVIFDMYGRPVELHLLENNMPMHFVSWQGSHTGGP